MKNGVITCLRGVEAPARVVIRSQNGQPHALFQVTSPREYQRLCRRRPVEELPRILPLSSPAHHLLAALVLDRLGGVEPPPLAVEMRQALLQALCYGHHLRKCYLLLLGWENPFRSVSPLVKRRQPDGLLSHYLEAIRRHAALVREAALILGGRVDHPLTAVAGGISRFLKPDHYPRLTQIAALCREFAQRWAEFFWEQVLPRLQTAGLQEVEVQPQASLMYDSEADLLIHSNGQSQEQWPLSAWQEKIVLHQEAWTYEPFAHLAARPWTALFDPQVDHLFIVGPLARLNSGRRQLSPAAAAVQEKLVDRLGPLPRWEVTAAYGALVVELVQAGEAMVELYHADRLSGPTLRTVPTGWGQAAQAALEGPGGLLVLSCQVDAAGLVEDIQILDPAIANNAGRCLLTQQVIAQDLARGRSWATMKHRLELSLLPW